VVGGLLGRELQGAKLDDRRLKSIAESRANTLPFALLFQSSRHRRRGTDKSYEA